MALKFIHSQQKTLEFLEIEDKNLTASINLLGKACIPVISTNSSFSSLRGSRYVDFGIICFVLLCQ